MHKSKLAFNVLSVKKWKSDAKEGALVGGGGTSGWWEVCVPSGWS